MFTVNFCKELFADLSEFRALSQEAQLCLCFIQFTLLACSFFLRQPGPPVPAGLNSQTMLTESLPRQDGPQSQISPVS